MRKTQLSTQRKDERGNVLFLILIAVALFAALSYAVTQSTRSGGGSTEREQAILSSAQMTQHPTAMRTAIIRMVLAGTDIAQVYFNAPGSFGSISTSNLVFHPDGGGAVYQQAAADIMSGNSQGTWRYNSNFDVPEVGRDGIGGNDVVAFLPGISTGVCEQLNEELVINTTNCALTGNIPTALAANVTDVLVNDDHLDGDTYPDQNTDHPDLDGTDSGGSCSAFNGQASGCFFGGNVVVGGTTGVNVFYSVLLER